MSTIIVVGPDGSGKSTICKNLSNKYGYPVKHFSYPESQEEKEQMFEMYKKEILSNDNVIYDRFAHCELVYGPIMRDKSWLTYEQLLELEQLIWERIDDSVILYCKSSIENLAKRCNERGEKYIPLDKLKSISEGYENLMLRKEHALPVCVYTT